jgi:hypothetical protein
MSKKRNSAEITAVCLQRIRALKEHTSPRETVPVGGTRYTSKQIVAVYQRNLDRRDAVKKARAQLDVALAAARESDDEVATFEVPVKSWALNHFGATHNATTELGFSPPKRTPRAPEDVALAVRRAAATREARGTMGKKARLKIKGVVEAPEAPGDGEKEEPEPLAPARAEAPF